MVSTLVVFLLYVSYVRACCRRESIPSTAQHSTAQLALHKAANQVRADESATTQQASRQSWREPACRRAFIRLAMFSNRTKESKSARPTKSYNQSQNSVAGVMIGGLSSISIVGKLQRCSFSPSFLFRTCVQRPGCYPGA